MSTSGEKRLEWKPRALRELSDSFEFIAAEDPMAAWRVLDRIRGMAGMLASQPFLGHKGRVRGTRELPIPRTPFLLIDRVQSLRIVIGRVLHHARRYP